MKCAAALEQLEEYFSMSVDDPQHIAMKQHMMECESCAEQFVVWSASEHWMEEDDADFHAEDAPSIPVSQVMERIYNEQPWLTPIHRRSHTLSLHSRQIIVGITAFFMAIFLCALVVLFIHNERLDSYETGGFMSIALAGSDHSDLYIDLPTANDISEPTTLHIVPIIPHYWIAFSLFGVTFAFLLLNWLTRVRE